MNSNEYAPWEQEHMQQEQEQQEREAWLQKLATRKFLTKGQWFHGYRRKVTVDKSEARKVLTTMNGRMLHLYSEDQTTEI